MLEIFFHVSFAFIVFTGVVYFSIFSWLKMHLADDINSVKPETLKHELKTNLARTV